MKDDNCDTCTKDFCRCVKEAFREGKKRSRDFRVNGVLKTLAKNNIDYTLSKTPNLVKIETSTKSIILSLKPVTDGNGNLNSFKFRVEGSSEWHTALKNKFIERIKQVQL